jgi:hypothetical protein
MWARGSSAVLMKPSAKRDLVNGKVVLVIKRHDMIKI